MVDTYRYHAILGRDQNPDKLKKPREKCHPYIQKKKDSEDCGIGDVLIHNDGSVVKTVQKKTNGLSKRKNSFPAMQYGNREACVGRPTALTITISPSSWQNILKDKKIKDIINKKEISQQCEVIWPEEDCPCPIFKLILPPMMSSNLSIVTKDVPVYKIVQYKINHLVWEAIRGTVNSFMYSGVRVKTDLEAGKVYLVGKSKKVTEVNPTFRNLVEETTRRIEKNNQSLTEVVPMSPAQYQIMCLSGLEKQMMEQVPQLKTAYDAQTKEIRISGLRYEVLTAKRELYNIQQQIKSKCFKVSPHLVQFLVLTSDEKLSCLLFAQHNINALLENADENAVKLTAYSEEVLEEAEKQFQQELTCRSIFVEEKGLLGSPEWRSLLSHLNRTLNAEKCTVLILKCPPGAQNDVVITGLTSNVQKCHQKVSDFLKTNATVRVDVPVKSKVMMQFIEDRRKDIWGKISKRVNVIKNGDRMCLSGPGVRVKEAALLIKNFLSSLHCDTLLIDKPGAKTFCAMNEKVHVATAKEEFNCAIHLQEAAIKDFVPGDPRYQVTLPNGLTISIYKGDLCRHNVDVIVNAANEDLQHRGGLAKAILKAAGGKLQDDCDCIIKKNGRVSPGDSVITDAGNLPCKQVIHTVGPRWSAGLRFTCESLLRRAITTSLQLAAENNHRSIAIPAVSSGIFAFPLKLCIENIVEAVRIYAENQRTTLQRIHLVDTNEETVKIFCEVTKDKLGSQTNTIPAKAPAIQHDVRVADSKKIQVPVVGGNDNAVKTKEGMIIKLLQKNIEDCTTDVIVNSVTPSLNLNVGLIPQALLSRAGSNLQKLLDKASSGAQVSLGSIFTTSGCHLNCQEVLHVVAPSWDNGHGASEKILRRIVKNCLTMSEQKQRKSISFPAIGTGGLRFPKALVASVMFDEIFQFSSSKSTQNLQEVHLILHPSDSATIKAFSTQLADYTDHTSKEDTDRQPTGTESPFFGEVTSPSHGVYEMTVGFVTYQVKAGDVTKEEAEIIVKSSSNNFTLCAGISKAILEAVGRDIEEFAKKLGLQPNMGHIMTQARNMRHCKWILHVADANHPSSLKKHVLDALQECEKYQATSVAFPALRTGAAGLTTLEAADSFLDAVVDFTESKLVSSLKTVKVVLFQQIMLNDFYVSMKKRKEATPPQPGLVFPGESESVKAPEIEKPVQKLSSVHMVESVTFSLCTDGTENLRKTKTWLQQQIDSALTEKVITEEYVSEIEEAEVQKISDLQKKYQVSVIYKPSDPSIRIAGLTQGVMAVSAEIETIINRIKERKARERAAELIWKLVEWRYEQADYMFPFDKMANLELEEAKNGNKTQITIQSPGNQMTANLKRAIATDNHGNQVRIHRVIKHEEDFLQVPQHWKPMDNILVMEVDVQPGTLDYSHVERMFQKSCQNKILKIRRVQNRDLWLNYQIKKHTMDIKNGSMSNEMELFHGTDSNSIQHINHNGFNRSYAGRNATSYGKGTYFAVKASYSAQNTYSKPDKTGWKHMFLARVLTGVYSIGTSNMLTPPAKNPAISSDLYDSITNSITHPGIFVIFHDIQAYPEYHIIFQ